MKRRVIDDWFGGGKVAVTLIYGEACEGKGGRGLGCAVGENWESGPSPSPKPLTLGGDIKMNGDG